MLNAEQYASGCQLLFQFWRSLDAGDFDRLIGLLTPSARWNRAGKWREGHEDIRVALSERPPNLFVRHLVTNVHGEISGDHMELSYMLIAHSRRRVDGDAPPFPSAPPALIVDYASTCMVTAEGWKLSSLSGVQAFSMHATG